MQNTLFSGGDARIRKERSRRSLSTLCALAQQGSNISNSVVAVLNDLVHHSRNAGMKENTIRSERLVHNATSKPKLERREEKNGDSVADFQVPQGIISLSDSKELMPWGAAIEWQETSM